MKPGQFYSDEALAIARLRQWCADRFALRSAKTVDYSYVGCARRNESRFDARLVRVIDFAKALSTLDAEVQAALIFTYRDRDRERTDEVARALHCSTRKISYLIPAARRKLADTLARLDLL